MAECSGLLLLKDEERNPLYTTTYGVGELIKYAISKEVKEIIIGIGGSATNDAGVGMLNSLGMKFLDENGNKLKPVGENLVKIKKIDDSEFLKDVCKAKFTVLCDVTNPLYGENGAAYVFAPQKGADENAVKLLDMGLRNFKCCQRVSWKRHVAFKWSWCCWGPGFCTFSFSECPVCIWNRLYTQRFKCRRTC